MDKINVIKNIHNNLKQFLKMTIVLKLLKGFKENNKALA